MTLLERLAANRRIPERIALVVAHPDDETVGLGSRLHLFDDLTLIHLTDGTPDDVGFAHRAGFVDNAAYATARRAELGRALAALGTNPARHLAYTLPDQRAHQALPALIDRLTHDLAGHAAVITHAYEQGHPDHDTAALAVARTRERLGSTAPHAVEFAGYYRDGDTIRFGDFYPDPNAPETRLPLSATQREAKRAAFAAHASQADTLAQFDPGRETLRPAPAYDFTRPAPPGRAVYQLWSFALTPEAWRAATA